MSSTFCQVMPVFIYFSPRVHLTVFKDSTLLNDPIQAANHSAGMLMAIVADPISPSPRTWVINISQTHRMWWEHLYCTWETAGNAFWDIGDIIRPACVPHNESPFAALYLLLNVDRFRWNMGLDGCVESLWASLSFLEAFVVHCEPKTQTTASELYQIQWFTLPLSTHYRSTRCLPLQLLERAKEASKSGTFYLAT